MPSGRDSFRRNRVAPSVQLHFSTSAGFLGVRLLDQFQVFGEYLQLLGKIGECDPTKLGRAPTPGVCAKSAGPAPTVWFVVGLVSEGALLMDSKDLVCRASAGVLLDMCARCR